MNSRHPGRKITYLAYKKEGRTDSRRLTLSEKRMNLRNYITKTEISARQNKSVSEFWPIGIDYGFSGVKGFSPNKVFCFPNCAVKVPSFSTLLDTSDRDILLRDKDGCWIIGEKAHDVMSPANAMNYESEMYERNRYFSPMFKALMKVGLALGLAANYFRKYKGEPIIVQTGLPPKYKDRDTSDIKEAIAGDYEFDLKVGSNPFQKFRFTVRPSDVYVMDQPKGSLFSAVTNSDGTQDMEGYTIMKSKTLVFDPGFKTLDIFNISAGMLQDVKTFDTLGMHEVFRRTVEAANRQYGANITISGMQKALKKGYISSFNRQQLKSTKLTTEFEELVEKNTRDVCNEALQKIFSIYDYMQDYDYMVVTGGTGDAWMSELEERFRGMDSLSLISANRKDPSLPNIYSNVRGYYLSLVSMLSRRTRRG